MKQKCIIDPWRGFFPIVIRTRLYSKPNMKNLSIYLNLNLTQSDLIKKNQQFELKNYSYLK